MSPRQRGGLVVATFPAFDLDDPASAGLLRDAGLELRLDPKTASRSPEDVGRLMAGAVAGIVSTDPFDRSTFAACPELRVLARVGVGVDSIDIQAATAARVVVTTTPGVNDETVADHAVATMLGAIRRVAEADASMRRGEWRRGGDDIGWELYGATVGIVGLGSIGRAVARRLAGFGTKLIGYDVASVELDGLEFVALDELLRRAHVVTIHAPLDDSTRGLVGRHELALMRADAILVNTSRGGIVDERALAAALRGGRLRAAAIDVFEDEPPLGSSLLELRNVVLTPHVAGLSQSSIKRMVEMAARSVVDVLAGRVPTGAVNPEAL